MYNFSNRTSRDYLEISDKYLLPAEPVVSVQMLTYNHAPYLAKAIEGVIAQNTSFSFELIIGEDCSVDNSREIALAYQKRYPHLIRVIYSDQNVGVRNNHLRVMEASRGEFIALCEGDDYWHNCMKLQLQVDFLLRHPECVVVHSDYDYRVGSRIRRSIMRAENRHVPVGNAYQQLQEGNWIGTATVLYRAEILKSFEATALANNNYQFGDYSRLLYASLHGEFGYLKDSLATYRYTPGSAMNSGYKSKLLMRQSIRQCRLDFIQETGIPAANHHIIDRSEYRLIYGSAYLAGNVGVMQNAYKWLEENDPQCSQKWKHALRLWIIKSGVLLWLVRVRAILAWNYRVFSYYEKLDSDCI